MNPESIGNPEDLKEEVLLARIEKIISDEMLQDRFFEERTDFHSELLLDLSDRYPDSVNEAMALPVWQKLISSSVPDGHEITIDPDVQDFVHVRIAQFLKSF